MFLLGISYHLHFWRRCTFNDNLNMFYYSAILGNIIELEFMACIASKGMKRRLIVEFCRSTKILLLSPTYERGVLLQVRLCVLEVVDEYRGEAGSHPGADLVLEYFSCSSTQIHVGISSITAMLRICQKGQKGWDTKQILFKRSPLLYFVCKNAIKISLIVG